MAFFEPGAPSLGAQTEALQECRKKIFSCTAGRMSPWRERCAATYNVFSETVNCQHIYNGTWKTSRASTDSQCAEFQFRDKPVLERQRLAFAPVEEHNEVPMDQRPHHGDFRNAAAPQDTVPYTRECKLKPEVDHRHGHFAPAMKRMKSSGRKKFNAGAITTRPGDRRGS